MYTEVTCVVRHFNDSSSQDVLFAPSDLETQIKFSNMKEQNSNKFELAASASMALSYGSVGSPKGLYILAESDFDAELVIGLISVTVPCRRSSATVAKENVVFFLPAAIDSCTIVNPGTTTLIGRFTVYGDP